MNKSFFIENRMALRQKLNSGEIAIFFAGEPKRQSADQYYSFMADRNFVYLTGLSDASSGFVLWLEKDKEMLFILPSDLLKERWTGRRVKPNEAEDISGIKNIYYIDAFNDYFHRAVNGKNVTLWLDLYKDTPCEPNDTAYAFAQRVKESYTQTTVKNSLPFMRELRTIKKPCEIDAIKKAVPITKAGIEAMMKNSKPGMFEYEYKALFDYELTKRGVLEPAFPSIIAAGKNNFCIHYYDYTGKANDGDMILNDVGARYDGLVNDVSRGWPCNGKFSDKQRLLYNCAYETSEYMFSIIKPGMPMADVDKTIHKYCGQRLVDIGLLDKVENESKYMWHGGAHHIGWDVHDVVAVDRGNEGLIAPNMVFCVDVGIYVEEWGIGFRLEDNCLVTETGCENLTASIPRSIDEIEDFMGK